MRSSMVALAVALAGCSAKAPQTIVDAALPVADVVSRQASTVLFVPGIMGSELVDRATGERVWGAFGSGHKAPARDPQVARAVALPLVVDGHATRQEDPELMPGGELLAAELDVGRVALNVRAYPGVLEGVIRALESEDHHYSPLDLSDAREGKSPLYAVGYDWRRSVTAETGWFHQDVLAAAERRREAGLDPRVDIVAHSMGTQLVRWYLRHGPARLGPDGLEEVDEDWDPAKHVRKVVLVAPPNQGEPSVLETLLDGERPNPLLPLYDPTLTASFPALYEMLPRPSDGRVVWDDDGTPVDLYDVALWVRYGWGPFAEHWDEQLSWLLPDAASREERLSVLRRHVTACLDHARRLHAHMDTPPAHEVEMHLFVGAGRRTPGVLRIDRETGRHRWGDHADGDGTVARVSALGAYPERFASVQVFEAEHMGITAEPRAVESLLYLLTPGRR